MYLLFTTTSTYFRAASIVARINPHSRKGSTPVVVGNYVYRDFISASDTLRNIRVPFGTNRLLPPRLFALSSYVD